MKTHAAHPKCPGCGRSLYKSKTVGAKVTLAMPYQFCRNPNCDINSLDEPPEVPKKPLAKAKPKFKTNVNDVPLKPLKKRKAVPAADFKPRPKESLAITGARARVAELIESAVSPLEAAQSVGLILALLNAQLGNLESANALIAEYALDERYGIQRF